MSSSHTARNEKAPGAGTPRAVNVNQTTTKGDAMNTSTDLMTTPAAGAPSMSSREIADTLEVRHDNAKRTMERLAKRGVITVTPMEEPTKGGGKLTTVYLVNQRDSYVVAAQLSPEMTARLVDRWQELEQQAAQQPLPQTMAEALRLAADQAEQLEQQAAALQEAAPKVAFAHQVEVSHDAITVGQAAKVIGTGRTRLFSFLRHHGWVNRRNEPYQSKIEAGVLDVKVGHWEHPEKGLQENITALVTGKGLVSLQALWAKQQEEAA